MDLGNSFMDGYSIAQDAKSYKQKIGFLVASPRSNTSKLGAKEILHLFRECSWHTLWRGCGCPGEQPAGQLAEVGENYCNVNRTAVTSTSGESFCWKLGLVYFTVLSTNRKDVRSQTFSMIF